MGHSGLRARPRLWLLGGLGIVLNMAIISLAISLLGAEQTVAVEGTRRIAVPFDNESAIWEPLRRWGDEEGRAAGSITDQERFGQHVEPAVLRDSPALLEILRQAFLKRERDSTASLSLLERDAIDVQGRLELYDRICRGGESEDGRGVPRLPGQFQIVALDRRGATWFSLATLRALCGADGEKQWQELQQCRRLENPDIYETAT